MKVKLVGGELDGREYEHLSLTPNLTIVVVDSEDKLEAHLNGAELEGVEHHYRLTDRTVEGMSVYESTP